MEFVIKQSDLVRELQTVTGVVEKRATLPILANLLLEAGPSGLSVGASDLEVTIRGTAKATVVKPGSVTLPAGKLYEIARSLPESDVQFKLLERHSVSISCERTRYKIAGQPRDEFPKFPDLDVTKGIALPAGTLRGHDRPRGFCDHHGRSSLLAARRASPRPGRADDSRSDRRYRLSYASGKIAATKGAGETRVIVPRKALGEVGKLAAEVGADSTVTFGRSGSHVFFTVGEHTLTTTVPEGAFPKYDEVMPKKCETEITLDKHELTDAVKRVSLVASDRFGRAVRFHLSNGRLELSSETELGEANEVLNVDYKGDDKTIRLQRQVLAGIPQRRRYRLGQARARSRERRRVGNGAKGQKIGDKPGQFRPEPAGDLDYRYIVMPRDL
jgi:DNA polymerase-3 subunit beta